MQLSWPNLNNISGDVITGTINGQSVEKTNEA